MTYATLDDIQQIDEKLEQHFQGKLKLEPSLTRALVSFQANKERQAYRWYRYKEAFSAALVEYLFHRHEVHHGRLLDPFAGSGTALFAARSIGLNVEGIELLPIGQHIVATRMYLENNVTTQDIAVINHWATNLPWEHTNKRVSLPYLRITEGAYPPLTQDAIERYVATLEQEREQVQTVLRFALLCVLESVSYTRKDGQYLRWDYRSQRRQGTKPFDKGNILEFNHAVCMKLREIVSDITVGNEQLPLFDTIDPGQDIHLYNDSCLNILPTLSQEAYDVIFTSPPYCNRYDYTRTYALELALLGIDQQGLSSLRQQMISCTVENRTKDLLAMQPKWAKVVDVADQNELLQAILGYLEQQKTEKKLNNNGIPRMVQGYFYEMACIIAECARVLKSGAKLFMINDNVRYAGASISVDMILSHFAEQFGFQVEHILVLPNGKGNSSQQMGKHGRDALRKCVYVWRKD